MHELKTNLIYCGDSLKILKDIPSKSVDLIYGDPPFFSQRDYKNVRTQEKSFKDTWSGGIDEYISWLRLILLECQRVLANTGSIYVHCDWHSNANIRLLMDSIFGPSNFQNEIIWYYHWGIHIKQRWNRKHDTLFFYSKTRDWYFNADAVREPYIGTNSMAQNPKYNKSYNIAGKLPEDVWYIPTIGTGSKERTGYPTQKPITLLQRIIKASSKESDIILDPFCGSGTTLAAASLLHRQFIGIDISPIACEIATKRCQQAQQG